MSVRSREMGKYEFCELFVYLLETMQFNFSL